MELIMKKITFLIISLMLLGIISCGEKTKEIKDVIDYTKKASEISDQVNDYQQKAEKKWAERQKKGDTLSLNFKELQKYLPQSVSGYVAEEPGGETTNIPGFSYSEAWRNFRIDSDGDGYIDYRIVDYNSSSGLFSSIAFIWMTGYSRETSEGYEKTFDPGIKDCYGWEQWNKESGIAEIKIAVAYRFIVQVTMDKQKDTEFAKSLAKKNLNELIKI